MHKNVKPKKRPVHEIKHPARLVDENVVSVPYARNINANSCFEILRSFCLYFLATFYFASLFRTLENTGDVHNRKRSQNN